MSEIIKKYFCNIEVLEYGTYVSFILKNESMFSPGEYNILKRCGTSSLVRCESAYLNGCRQLIYITQGLCSFSQISGEVKAFRFLRLVNSLFRAVPQVEKNGFLTRSRIYARPEHIYINPVTDQVMLLYLPVSDGCCNDFSFEKELRSGLAKMIIDKGLFVNDGCSRLLADLQDTSLNIKEIAKKINIPSLYQDGALLQEKEPSEIAPEHEVSGGLADGALELTSFGRDQKLKFLIDRKNFIIGRSSEFADGIITDDRSVGRLHCRITNSEGKYYLEDMGSVNGTFINEKRLPVNVPVSIKNQDTIRLADLTFRVSV